MTLVQCPAHRWQRATFIPDHKHGDCLTCLQQLQLLQALGHCGLQTLQSQKAFILSLQSGRVYKRSREKV